MTCETVYSLAEKQWRAEALAARGRGLPHVATVYEDAADVAKHELAPSDVLDEALFAESFDAVVALLRDWVDILRDNESPDDADAREWIERELGEADRIEAHLNAAEAEMKEQP